jgi:prepilin peptidase CpaA
MLAAQPTLEVLSSVALVATAAAATLHDVRTRRIPNWVALGGVVAALALRAAMGRGELIDGLVGAALGLSIGLLLFALRLFGGGDGKLLMAVGAFLGPRPFLSALLVIALVGGVLGLFEAARRGVLAAVIRRTGRRLLTVFAPGRAGFEPVAVTPEGFTVPYGLAIGVGALITWFLGVSLP